MLSEEVALGEYHDQESDGFAQRESKVSEVADSYSNAKEISMTDPRNIAHDQKVQQEKRHHDEEIALGADTTPQPGKKTHKEHYASDIAKAPDEAAPVPTFEKPLDPRPWFGLWLVLKCVRWVPSISDACRWRTDFARGQARLGELLYLTIFSFSISGLRP